VPQEYIVDPNTIAWRDGQVAGITFKCQILLSGDDGGPEALRFRFADCPSVFAHMHLTSQFQLLLRGRMDFPKSTMKLRGVAVHYTDHNFPYGPFSVSENHEMLVLHPKQGGLISMADRDARRQINLQGRHFHGNADTEWSELPESQTIRLKHLFPPASGPAATMVQYPPYTRVDLPSAPYGRYEVVLTGSVSIAGCTLVFPGFRYVRDDNATAPVQSGPDGALLMFLGFDDDAHQGGLAGDRLSVAAAAAMARAI
jgi:hypothetical protein